MKKFIITGKPLTLKGGTVQLTKDQADSRYYCLKVLNPRKGLYLVIGNACFKVGEIIGYDGPDYKRLMNAGLVDMETHTRAQEEKEAKKKEKARVAAEVKAKLAEAKEKARVAAEVKAKLAEAKEKAEVERKETRQKDGG